MEETKKRILKIGRQLGGICRAAMIIGIAACVGYAGVMILSLISRSFAEKIANGMEGDDLVDTIIAVNIAGIDPRLQVVITASLYILLIGAVVFVLNVMRKLIKKVTEGETPFTTEAAKTLKTASRLSLLLIFYDPIIAIVVTLLLRLFSALFEYGAYLQTKADQTARIQEEMIVSFAEITENKSSQTGNHVKRVSEYSKILAHQLGLPDEDCEKLRLASTMHDIGKLLVSAQILEKPARLTDEEFAEIKKHSGYGGELLENVEGDIMELARTIALDHHERPDGRGYPLGKQGDEISMEGRIVAVADVYDALTSKRSYKEPWAPQEAFDEIVKNSGTQFDDRVVEAFKAAFPQIEDTRMSYSDTAKLTFKTTAQT